MNGLVTNNQYDKIKKLDIRVAPGVDDVIDALRRKYNIVIYNTSEPFVGSISKKIEYGFSVKKCNPVFGWNARTYLGQTEWHTNIYQAKREAINIAINWILSQKSQESKKSKTVRINGRSKTK